MLRNNFYTITALQQGAGNINASLELNVRHVIFEGHFPGQPVVPGVCMVQIIQELLETATGSSLQLKTADQIKFLSMVDPRETTGLSAAVSYITDDGSIKATATLSKDQTVCLKMKAVFVVVGC
ncbi:MAG: 3-hydroxyacyl-ACP dehydratase [Chitinophagaceae bacterium]|nr:3-hydroxyacyl-ACP dehydratase [Chitinophagaceae bacterium]